MTRALHKLWLKIAALIVAIGGPIFFLGTMEPTVEAARLTLDILAWPLDGAQTAADSDARFLLALSGGFLMGWGVLIWMLSGRVYDAAPEAVRVAVVTGFCSWFVLDSAGSILSGHAANAVWNVVVLLSAIGPMWLPAKEDRVSPSSP